MRFTLILFCSAFAFQLYGQGSRNATQALDSSTVKKAEFIALIKVVDDGDEMIACDIVRSFKINKVVEDQVLLVISDNFQQFNGGDQYLIFAKENDEGKFYIDKHSRIVKKEESEKDIAFLLSYLPCKNFNLMNMNVPCYRTNRHVCGCDSKTYGSVCEALRKGVVIFSKGECK